MELHADRLWIAHSPEVPWTVEPLDGWARGSTNLIKFAGPCCKLLSAENILGATLEVVGTRIFNDEEEVNLQHQPLLVACYDTQGYVGGILPWRGHTPGRKRQYLGMRADLLQWYIKYEGKWTNRCSKWRDKPAGENRRQTRGRRTTNYSTVQLNPPVSSHVTKDLHRLPSGQRMQRDYHYLA